MRLDPRTLARPWLAIACLILATVGEAHPARAVMVHSGSQDPGTEGWLVGGGGVGSTVGPIAADPDYPGVGAWSIDDPSTAAGSALYLAAPASEIPLVEPWLLSARLRVVDPGDAVDMGVFLEVNDQSNRRFLLTFGSNAAGQTLVHLSSDGSVSGGPNAWTIAKAIPATTTTDYVRVDLYYDGATAHLVVDDQQVGSGLTGYVALSVPPRVLWGAGSSPQTGHGHYADVRFERAPTLECSNGLDDDGDGVTDFTGGDGDCASAYDPRERPPSVPCDDGVDQDGDGICDVDELRLGTNASATDSDGDGLLDADELLLYGTNPALADSDGDGFSDGVELAAGRDPNDPLSGPPPVPAWDWIMPSRFIDRDPASPATLGDRYFVGDVDPGSWRVDFDACATDGLVFEYRWYVDDVLVETRADCAGFQHLFPAEGSHQVRLEAVGTAGEQLVLERTVEVQDLLVFGLGDSYGSGEGNADRPITQGMVDDYADTLDALDQAQSDLADAYAAWQTALSVFNDLVARVNNAYAKLQAWQDAVAERNAACSTFPFTGCAAAQLAASSAAADLVVALAQIGLPEPSNWTYAAIYQSVQNVYNAGLATYDLALSAYDLASSAAQLAQQAVATARGALAADWQNEDCHRSAFSGQVLAAKRLEQMDPHTSVTFVHLACSGSQIRTGGHPLIGSTDDDPADVGNTSHQVTAMRTLAGSRTVDALFLSIGGNDVGFSSLIETCMKTEPCYSPGWVVDTAAQAALDALCTTTGWFLDSCSLDFPTPAPGESAQSMLDAALPTLATRYSSLHHWLEGEYPMTTPGVPNTLGRIVAPERVFLTQYPDFAHGDGGVTCGWQPGDPPGDATASLPGVSQPEHVWASQVAAPAIELEMRAAAAAHGWNFVDGISEAYAENGYCATDHWIVRIGESLLSQRDHMGTAHPNRDGHLVYRDALRAAALPEPGLGTGLLTSLGALAWLARRRRADSRRAIDPAPGRGDGAPC